MFVVGDGVNDLVMIEWFGVGIVYWVKLVVVVVVDFWVDYGDLIVLFYLQGYVEIEFVLS